METIIAGQPAILRQEGRLVMGWIETMAILRYGESVAEVMSDLEVAVEEAHMRPARGVVAARLAG